MRRTSNVMIDQGSIANWSSPVSLNINGNLDPSFSVRFLAIKLNLYCAGSTADTQMLAESFGQNWKLEILWRDGSRPMIDNVSLAALDLWAQRCRDQLAFGYDALSVGADDTDPLHHEVDAAATNELEEWLFIVPLEQPLAAKPGDFVPRLSQIGKITLKPSTTVDASGYVSAGTSNGVITAYAIGEYVKPGTFKVPSQFKVRDLSGETGNNVTLDMEGRPVLSVFEYGIDVATNPISEEELISANLDGNEVANWTGETGEDVLAFLYGAGAGSPSSGIAALRANTRVLPIIEPRPGFRQSELPTGRNLRIAYSARITTPNSTARFCVTTLYADNIGAGLARQIPGAEMMDPDSVRSAVRRPGVKPGQASELPVTLLGSLPATIVSE
jgi:hypothetical protein